MSLDDDAEPRRLELPDPYRLQNRLLWACAALLLAAGATSLGEGGLSAAPNGRKRGPVRSDPGGPLRLGICIAADLGYLLLAR